MKKNKILIIFFLSTLAFAQNNTGVFAIDTLPIYDWDIKTERNSLPLTLGLSLAIPGGGQFYTKHFTRGGFLFAIEGALIYEAFYNKPRQNEDFNKKINAFKDSVALYQNLLTQFADSTDSVHFQTGDTALWQSQTKSYNYEANKVDSKKRAARDLLHSELAWLAGLHIYGLFDAYGIWRNNQGHSVETHTAFSAIWRAAVFPGWGQLYNDEYGKAGLLYMGIFGSAVSFWSRQKMVEYHLERLHAAQAEENLSEIAQEKEDILFFRKKRNQYIWAISLFYIYSIADAAVDAMLHDFDSPAYFVLSPTDFFKGIKAEAGFQF
ncbi:hypothetical protein AGMMS49938_08920 [Fibrobacterales bacterium]|nr:hypothetical protein AGMMS49938_08920 [Fibrobacterales bacterium]